MSIFIAIFSLIFVLFLFILPIYKKTLKNNCKDLTNKYQKVKSNSNYIKLQAFQGKIYKNNIAFNHLSISMIVATVTFGISLITLFILNDNTLSYILLFISIFFDIVFICRLAILIKKIYTSDLAKLESMIEKHNQKLDKKFNKKVDKDNNSEI